MNLPSHPLYAQAWPEGEFRFFQIGFVVNDIIEAASKWTEVHGVGPFHLLPVGEQKLEIGGELSLSTIQIGVAQAGPVQIELIQQHCDRPSIYREWTNNGTCALHQLATVTQDYDGKKAHFQQLGYKIAELKEAPMRVAYIDTVAQFGFYTEVLEETPGYLQQLKTVSDTCANWDGSDPVRLLTRDGYRVP